MSTQNVRTLLLLTLTLQPARQGENSAREAIQLVEDEAEDGVVLIIQAPFPLDLSPSSRPSSDRQLACLPRYAAPSTFFLEASE